MKEILHFYILLNLKNHYLENNLFLDLKQSYDTQKSKPSSDYVLCLLTIFSVILSFQTGGSSERPCDPLVVPQPHHSPSKTRQAYLDSGGGLDGGIGRDHNGNAILSGNPGDADADGNAFIKKGILWQQRDKLFSRYAHYKHWRF